MGNVETEYGRRKWKDMKGRREGERGRGKDGVVGDGDIGDRMERD